MKKAILPAIIAMFMLAATSAHAQVSVNVRIGIPAHAFPGYSGFLLRRLTQSSGHVP